MDKQRQKEFAQSVFDELYKQLFVDHGVDWTFLYFWAALIRHIARRISSISKETNTNNHFANQIAEVIKANKDNEFSLCLVMKGERTATKNWNISNDEAELIYSLIRTRDE